MVRSMWHNRGTSDLLPKAETQARGDLGSWAPRALPSDERRKLLLPLNDNRFADFLLA